MNPVSVSDGNKCAFCVHAWNASRGTEINVLNASAMVSNKSISVVFNDSDLASIVILRPQVCSLIIKEVFLQGLSLSN